MAAGLPAEVTVALDDIAGAIRDGLLAFSCSAGMMVIGQIMAEEMTTKVGPKGRHDPDRAATRNGTAPGSVALGGRTVPVERPRATLTGGGELTLDSYALFSSTDLLTQLTVEGCWPASPRAVTAMWPSRSAPSSRRSPAATPARRSHAGSGPRSDRSLALLRQPPPRRILGSRGRTHRGRGMDLTSSLRTGCRGLVPNRCTPLATWAHPTRRSWSSGCPRTRAPWEGRLRTQPATARLPPRVGERPPSLRCSAG